ncbi:MAG: hypothetical protein P8Y29_01070 [Gemmatimonadota bacterium]
MKIEFLIVEAAMARLPTILTLAICAPSSTSSRQHPRDPKSVDVLGI